MIPAKAQSIPSKIKTVIIDGKLYVKATLKMEPKEVVICFQVNEDALPQQEGDVLELQMA